MLLFGSSNFNDQNFVQILLARSTFRSLLFKNWIEIADFVIFCRLVGWSSPNADRGYGRGSIHRNTQEVWIFWKCFNFTPMNDTTARDFMYEHFVGTCCAASWRGDLATLLSGVALPSVFFNHQGSAFELWAVIGCETILWIKVCCGCFYADVASPPLSATLRSSLLACTHTV